VFPELKMRLVLCLGLGLATAGTAAEPGQATPVHDLQDSSVRYLTGRDSFDDWVDDLAWIDDGRAILFEAQHHGRTPLYRLELGNGKIERVLTHACLDGWDVSPSGEHVYYCRRGVGDPPEIFRVRARGGRSERLTQFNAELEAEVDIRPVEEFWVDGDGDYKVHVFLVKPHDFDPSKKYPLILNVHGGPQSQWADSYRGDWQVYPGKGYVVAFPNPTGSSGYGQELVDGIACDWGGRVYRDLMKVTDALEALPYIDGERMGAMGLVLRRLHDDVVRGPHRSFQGQRGDDGPVRLAVVPRRDRRGLVSGEGPVRDTLELRAVRPVVAIALRREVQDALPGDHRGARLPRAVHPEPGLLHGVEETGRTFPIDRLSRRRPLARPAR
jgi:hypothetical protein